MNKENIILKVKKLFPELINEKNELLLYKDHKKVFEEFNNKKQERFFYSLTTGRHFYEQNYKNMKTEDYLNIKFLENFKESKNYIDVSFKDLDNKYSVLIENGITNSNNIEEKIKEKFIQVINYLIAIMQDDTTYKINNNKVFLQVNLYDPEKILKNNKQYETFCSTNQETFDDFVTFEHTGIFQRLWVLDFNQCNSLKDNFTYGVNLKDLINMKFFKEIFDNHLKSSNFITINAENSKKISLDGNSQFFIKPEQIWENNNFLKKIPFRSVQRGTSQYDNTREIDLERVKILSNKMTVNFLEILIDNEFNDAETELSQEMRRPGWNDRQLKGSKEETLISNGVNQTLIISSDMALSNEQHNSYALLQLKKESKEIENNNNIEDKRIWFKNKGYTLYQELQENEMKSFFRLIESVNPTLSIELFINKKNGRRSAEINNSIEGQSVLDKATFLSKSKLQTIAQNLNILNDEFHFYSGTDITQDEKQNVSKNINNFDITNLLMINSSFKKGCEIAKTSKKDLNTFIKKIIDSENLGNIISKEEAEKIFFMRKIFTQADKKTENLNGIKELYEENINDEPQQIKKKKEKLLTYLDENFENFDPKTSTDCLKNYIKPLPKNIGKEFKEIINKLERLLENHIEFTQSKYLKPDFIKKFILEIQNIGIKVNTNRLFNMVNIYNIVNEKDSKEFKVIFNSKEIIIRLVSIISGYLHHTKKLDFNVENFEKIYNQIIYNLKDSKRENWLPVEIRNKNYSDLDIIHKEILDDLFKDII